MKNIALIITGIVLLFTSCVKDKYDFENATGSITPGAAVPLASSSLSIQEVIKALDSDFLVSGENGLLKLIYNDTVFSLGIDDLVELPEKTVSHTVNVNPVEIDDQTILGAITLGQAAPNFTSPADSDVQSADGSNAIINTMAPTQIGTFDVGLSTEFQNVTFSQGQLTVTLTNNWPVAISDVKMAIINKANGNAIDTFDFGTVNVGESKQDFSDLAGKEMYNELETNLFSLGLVGDPNPVFIDLADELNIEVSVTNGEIVSGSAIIPNQEMFEDEFTFDFDVDNQEELTEIELLEGNLNYDIDFGIREDADLILTIPSATKNGQPFQVVRDVQSDNINATTVQGNVDLADYVIDLTDGGTAENRLTVEIAALIKASGQIVPFDTSDKVEAEITISDLKFKTVKGYFGQQTIPMPTTSSSLEFGNNEIISFFEFIEPEVNLFIDNGFGIPFNLDNLLINFIGDQSVELEGIPDPFSVVGASSQGEVATSNLLINNATNMNEVVTSKPTQVEGSGDFVLNPDGKTLNFASYNSQVKLRAELEIPLYGKIKNFMITDTIEQDFEEVFNDLQSLKLRTVITNQFPIDIKIQIYFADENYNIIDSIGSTKTPIAAAPVDDQGNVLEVVKKITDVDFDRSKIENVQPAKYLLITSTISTADNGTVAGKIYDYYSMQVKLALAASVKVEF